MNFATVKKFSIPEGYVNKIMVGGQCLCELIPAYHHDEAERVIENITTFKTAHPNNLIFGAVSDIHILNADATYEAKSKKSAKYSAFALEEVGAKVGCDFIVNLGDNCWENGIDTDNAYIGAKYSIDAYKPAFERLTSYNLVGNHDKCDDTQKQFNLIGSSNVFDDYGLTQIRGFGYKDYTSKKVRVIVLNTCDYLNASGGCALSYEQKDFLLRALDLSAKTNASEWQILLLSHIPLDWNGGDYNFYSDLQTILNAYEDGATASITVNSSYVLHETPSNYATYSNGKLVYDYSGKNASKIIANIHGHVHTNKISKIANTSISRVATANTNPDLNKSESYPDYGDYSITATEAAKIKKNAYTVKDTSVTFYCIDLSEKIIYAYGYGADIDRVVSYDVGQAFSITYNLTNCATGYNATTAIEGTTYSTTLTATGEAELTSVVVTMGGVDITADCYADGKITIARVTGSIVITAVAEVKAWTQVVTDMVVAPRSNWEFNKTTGTVSLAASNQEGAIGVSTSNNYAFTDRESNPIYVMPVPTQAKKVILTNSDGVTYTYSFVLLKETGGVLSEVEYSNKISALEYEWSASSVDYILIRMHTADGSNIPWGYSDSQVTVTFSNGGTAVEPDEPEITEIRWDISERTAVTNLYAAAAATKSLSDDNYYYGAYATGLINYSVVSDVSVSGNDLTFTSNDGSCGIGLPYHLEAGAKYTFSFTASVDARPRIVSFNADGTYISGSDTYGSAGTDISYEFTAPTDETQWLMVIITPRSSTVGQSITCTNISLSKN